MRFLTERMLRSCTARHLVSQSQDADSFHAPI
jgi:hypothetical protein